MYVARVSVEEGLVIRVPQDDWDLEGIALVQCAVNDAYTVKIVPCTNFADVIIDLQMDTSQMQDIGIYLITQATE